MTQAQEDLVRSHEEEARRMEEEQARVEEEKRKVEEEKKDPEKKRRRQEQEARAASLREQRRLRGLQQSVVGGADDVIDGVSNLFNVSSSGTWTVTDPIPARALNAFDANAFADKRAAGEARRQADDALRAARKAKRDQAANESFDTAVSGVEALMGDSTSDLTTDAPPPPRGAEGVERQDLNDPDNLDFDDDNDDDDDDDDYETQDDSEGDYMDTHEHDGRGEGLPPGEVAQPALTGPQGVLTAPPLAPPILPPPPQTSQAVVESSTLQVTPAADSTAPAPFQASPDATLVIPPHISDLSSISQEQAVELVKIYNAQVDALIERKHTAIYHDTQRRLRAERDALHPQAERRAYVPTQITRDALIEEDGEIATVETRETLQLCKIINIRSIGATADMGNGTLRDISRGKASNQRKRRREGAARRIAEATRSTGSGSDQRQTPLTLDPPQHHPRDDRRAKAGGNNLQIEVREKRRRVSKGGPPDASASLSSTVMDGSARLPHDPAPRPPPPQRQRSRDISPIRVPTQTTTTTNNQGGALAGAAANLPPPPPPPVNDDQQRREEQNANKKKRNRRPKRKSGDASTSNRSSTSTASASSPSHRPPQSPEDLLTEKMLAIAIKLPNHPRPKDIQKVVDILPAAFYPNSSPMDRAIHAADHAADRARLARKLIEQYNFRMKVVGEHDAKVAQMAQLLSDAQKDADRVRAEFAQSDGQMPSTSGTQRHSASSSNHAPPSGRNPPPRHSRKDDAPSYRGGKGGRGKGRK